MHSSVARKPAALLAVLAAVALPFLTPLAARADDGPGAGVGVARISLIHGDVAVQRGDSTTPVTAVINAPVLGADYVTTGDGARAEIQFDGASMVRLSANTQMRFTHLDKADRSLQLAQGTIDLRLLRGTDGRSGVDTPSVTVRPRQSGSYRITVTNDGTTYVTVRTGEAAIVTPQGERIATSGNTIVARGSAANPDLQSVAAIAYDDFDRFNTDRDDRHERALASSARYVDRDIVGVDDLDTYGRWVNDGSYGNVWVPTAVAPGWAPYRDGRWVWEDRYGWTWVGYEPWGWAPYHYGRWYRSTAYGWCWFPPAAAYPVAWQPGLVAFFGSGNFSIGFGNIAWVPLAPFEPYYPWWGSGYGNTTIVNNITTVNNVYNVYGNGNAVNGDVIRRIYKNAPYATTAQPNKRFILGRFDHPRAVPPGELAHLQIVKGALPVVPTADNLRFSDKPLRRSLVLNAAPQQRTFAGDAVVVQRTPFDEQRAAVSAITHLRSTQAQANAARPSVTQQNSVQQNVTQQPAAGTKRAAPWRQFDGNRTPAVIVGGETKAAVTTGAAEPVTVTPARSHGPNDAWARFGERRGTPVGARSGPADASTGTTRTLSPAVTSGDAEAAPARRLERMPRRATVDADALALPPPSRSSRASAPDRTPSAPPPRREGESSRGTSAPPPERRAPAPAPAPASAPAPARPAEPRAERAERAPHPTPQKPG